MKNKIQGDEQKFTQARFPQLSRGETHVEREMRGRMRGNDNKSDSPTDRDLCLNDSPEVSWLMEEKKKPAKGG